jgi:hypothetical protein
MQEDICMQLVISQRKPSISAGSGHTYAPEPDDVAVSAAIGGRAMMLVTPAIIANAAR